MESALPPVLDAPRGRHSTASLFGEDTTGMSLTSRTRAPRRAVLLGTGALLLAVVCSACGVGAQAEPEAGA